MPIQCNITQASGAIAGYHVVDHIESFPLAGTAKVSVTSWADQSHFSGGAPTLAQFEIDISSLLAIAPQATLSTFGQQVLDSVEKYLLTTPQFSGGTQVS